MYVPNNKENKANIFYFQLLKQDQEQEDKVSKSDNSVMFLQKRRAI